ncbi:MAG: oligosaccharide flippase family protein [Candidatus Pacearchaeota archaeon]
MAIEEKSLTKQAIKGSAWNFTSSLVMRAGSLIFSVILARMLLLEGFGLYNLVLSIALTFMFFSSTGINETLVRYIPESLKSKKLLKKNYFHTILKLKFILVLVTSLLLLIISYPLSEYIFKKPQAFFPLVLASVYIFILSLEGFFTAFFYAVKKSEYVVAKESISQVLRIGLVLIISLLLVKNLNVFHVFLVLIISTFITLSFSVYNNYRLFPEIFKNKEPAKQEDKKRVFNFFMYSTLGFFSFMFLGNIDTIMLGIFVPGTEAIGIYRAAFNIVSSISGLLAFSSVLIPIFVQVKKENLEHAFNRVFKYTMIVSVPSAFGIAALGNYFLFLLYGRSYLESTLPLYFLSMLIILSVQVTLFISLFSTREKNNLFLSASLFVMALNILLNYLLIKYFLLFSPNLAATGVAIATMISWIIYSIGLYIFAKNKLNIKVDLSLMIKPILSSIIMVLSLLFIKNLLNDINLFTGILLVTTGFFVYILSMLIFRGINREDFKLFKLLFDFNFKKQTISAN